MTADGFPIVDTFEPHSVAPGMVARMAKRFSWMPDGAAATYPLIVIAGARPGPTAALVAGIHGDEYEGPAALWRVLAAVTPENLCGRLLVVPVAHGAAFSAGTRTSPIDGVNLARIFPGDPGGTTTLRLAHDLFETVVRRADFLVDLHSGGSRLAFVQVAGFYPVQDGIDAALAEQSLHLARGLRLPWLWRLPGRSGVLSFEAMRAGVAATGAEAGGRGGCLEADVHAYAQGVLGVLSDRGMIQSRSGLPAPPAHAHCLDGDFALAPVSGFLEPAVGLGERVQAGKLLARIRAPSGAELSRIVAETDAVVMAERHLRSIAAGEWATCAVRELAL